MNYYILFNPHAGDGTAEKSALELARKFGVENCVYNMTEVESYKTLLTDKDAEVIILGGDGTLNRFVNDTYDLELENKVFLYPIGTGNDFLRDLGMENATEPVEITKYIKNLPACEIDGVKKYFINGVGYGIDGYCAEEGDRQKKLDANKKVNYTAIAIKGLLFKFKSRKATVTVDGVKHEFKRAWLSPCMNGRFYGGGMMPTPDQDRLNEERSITTMLFHGLGKLGALMLFPKIFKGEHVKKAKKVAVLSGQEIIVEFDKPCAAQIDGETVSNVSRCRFISSKIANAEKEAQEAKA